MSERDLISHIGSNFFGMIRAAVAKAAVVTVWVPGHEGDSVIAGLEPPPAGGEAKTLGDPRR